MASISMTPLISFECPHCSGSVVIGQSDVHCGVFRHAVYRCSGERIPDHSPKELCDRLVAEGRVFGCAKPFRLFREKEEEGGWVAEKCKYN